MMVLLTLAVLLQAGSIGVVSSPATTEEHTQSVELQRRSDAKVKEGGYVDGGQDKNVSIEIETLKNLSSMMKTNPVFKES